MGAGEAKHGIAIVAAGWPDRGGRGGTGKEATRKC